MGAFDDTTTNNVTVTNSAVTSSGIDNNTTISTGNVNIDLTEFVLRTEIEKKKVLAEIEIERRKQKMEELRIAHQIELENRVQEFNENEAARRHKLLLNNDNQHWLKAYWRPAMGWCWMLICLFDFILAPIMMAFLPLFIKGMTYTPWSSLTMGNGGMIHLAFGAVLGINSWTRGQQTQQLTGLMNMPSNQAPNNR